MDKKCDPKYIGENSYHLRKNILHLSQEKFSEKVGLCTETISNIERGKYFPSVANLVNISNVMNVPVEYFLRELEG